VLDGTHDSFGTQPIERYFEKKTHRDLIFLYGYVFMWMAQKMPQRHSRIPAGNPPAVGPLPTAASKH
jgi:hypothetical protein